VDLSDVDDTFEFEDEVYVHQCLRLMRRPAKKTAEDARALDAIHPRPIGQTGRKKAGTCPALRSA